MNKKRKYNFPTLSQLCLVASGKLIENMGIKWSNSPRTQGSSQQE